MIFFDITMDKILKQFGKNKIEDAVKISNSFSETTSNLGLDPKNSNIKKNVERSVKRLKLSTEHFDSIQRLKNRLYKEKLKERKCELCGQDENWKGKKMSLILDHINGIHNDNRLENLRIVCPNCNATLDTHCGKNTKEKIKKIRSEERLSQRKVIRPSFSDLENDVNLLGLEGTGRKYGVTGNAVKKWIKNYQKI